MKANLFVFNFILLTLVSCLLVSAQLPNADGKVFDKDGLSFSYPSNWQLTDQSTAQMQHRLKIFG